LQSSINLQQSQQNSLCSSPSSNKSRKNSSCSSSLSLKSNNLPLEAFHHSKNKHSSPSKLISLSKPKSSSHKSNWVGLPIHPTKPNSIPTFPCQPQFLFFLFYTKNTTLNILYFHLFLTSHTIFYPFLSP